jgi:hypothetical protein
MFREIVPSAIHNRLKVATQEAAQIAAVGIHLARNSVVEKRATPYSPEPSKAGRHRKSTLQVLPAVVKSTVEEILMGRTAQVWDKLHRPTTASGEPGLPNAAPDQAQPTSSENAVASMSTSEPVTSPPENSEV